MTPSVLEDSVPHLKTSRFGSGGLPEAAVQLRGVPADGYFEPYQPWTTLTRASFLQDATRRTPVRVRISPPASATTVGVLDGRAFAVTFDTDDGPFDLVIHAVPVFDAPDAAAIAAPAPTSAHDDTWDAVSHQPAMLHRVLWAMADDAVPPSLRMRAGYAVHTFRFTTAAGLSTFGKFHLRPWDAVGRVHPSWELSVQAIDDTLASSLPFDIHDLTKLVPEELVPLTPLGRIVLHRHPDDVMAATDVDRPGLVVPGIEVDRAIEAPCPEVTTWSEVRRLRRRDASIADHYSQARMVFRSMNPPERQHIVGAFATELGRLRDRTIRDRMLGHLAVIDGGLVAGVERRLGVSNTRAPIMPAARPVDLPLSPGVRQGRHWSPGWRGHA